MHKQIVLVTHEYEVVGKTQKEIDFLISQLDKTPSVTEISGGYYKAKYTGKTTVCNKEEKSLAPKELIKNSDTNI